MAGGRGGAGFVDDLPQGNFRAPEPLALIGSLHERIQLYGFLNADGCFSRTEHLDDRIQQNVVPFVSTNCGIAHLPVRNSTITLPVFAVFLPENSADSAGPLPLDYNPAIDIFGPLDHDDIAKAAAE